ncbi:MAG: 2-succinyl-5-enolpyruvyl-6-hydroxy-3-cyclohexene-1-carboxylic-acid synthase [Actinomycetota bacterium]|nr:2-succinyl-5-enolpyruvyl-6-hydroxy-3-cyclohexene-1-carboxylic-acid synthase [Actinomycetota bacterium]
MTRDANTGEALAFVDEWVRGGVTVASLAPGSRSTPLALALAADRRIRLEVFLDERSAAFFALGAAKASGRPAVVLTTSGTAAANIHPAVVEAAHSRAPLLACTADRPPELRDTGANQAIDQVKLFGSAVRWFADVGVPEDASHAGRYWRSVAARSVATATGPPAGPVHLNVTFREPLVPTGEPVPSPGRSGTAPWVVSRGHRPAPDAADVERLASLVARAERGLIVAGWGAAADPGVVEQFAHIAGWPVLADPLSGLRTGARTVSTYDALLRAPAFAADHRPEVVVQLGAPLTGRVSSTWLGDVTDRILVDPDGAWLDPARGGGERVAADATGLLHEVAAAVPGPRDGEWSKRWLEAEVAARRALDDLLDSWDEPFEGRVARDLVDGLPAGATLVVGSSMPVRDVESFARPRTGLRFVANRGASGIDGFNSTTLGVAAASAGSTAPVAGLAGDLTFLHDAGGLLAAPARRLDAVLVVVDNDGGGVFSFLPQARSPEHFDTLFGTPHGIDLSAVAAAYRVPTRRIDRAPELMPAVVEGLGAGGLRVVVVPSDRSTNVDRHRQAWEAVAAAVTN